MSFEILVLPRAEHPDADERERVNALGVAAQYVAAAALEPEERDALEAHMPPGAPIDGAWFAEVAHPSAYDQTLRLFIELATRTSCVVLDAQWEVIHRAASQQRTYDQAQDAAIKRGWRRYSPRNMGLHFGFSIRPREMHWPRTERRS